MGIMIFKIRTFFAHLVIAIGSIMVDVFKDDPAKTDKWRLWISRNVLKSVGLKYHVTGKFEKETQLIIANHQSMIDIFLLESIIGADIRFVGRKGIMDVWPVGLVVRAVGHITIDREDKRSGVKMLREVRDKKDKHVIIFPEGTRSSDGEILKFESGAKMVAEKLQLQVQPIVIENMTKLYNETSKISKKGVIHVKILPPLSLEDGWFEKSREAMIIAQKECSKNDQAL